jgi:hypothetical protein
MYTPPLVTVPPVLAEAVIAMVVAVVGVIDTSSNNIPE